MGKAHLALKHYDEVSWLILVCWTIPVILMWCGWKGLICCLLHQTNVYMELERNSVLPQRQIILKSGLLSTSYVLSDGLLRTCSSCTVSLQAEAVLCSVAVLYLVGICRHLATNEQSVFLLFYPKFLCAAMLLKCKAIRSDSMSPLKEKTSLHFGLSELLRWKVLTGVIAFLFLSVMLNVKQKIQSHIHVWSPDGS